MSARTPAALLAALFLVGAAGAQEARKRETAKGPGALVKAVIQGASDLRKLRVFLEKNPQLLQDLDEAGIKAVKDAYERERRRGPRRDPGAPDADDEAFYRLFVSARQSWLDVRLGEYAARRRDYQAALEDYRRALQAEPANADALVGYGAAAYHLGDTAQARQAAEQALAADPANRDALVLRGAAEARAPTARLPSSPFERWRDPEELAPGEEGGDERLVSAEHYAGSGLTPEQAAAAAASVRSGPAERSRLLMSETKGALAVGDFAGAHALAARALAEDPSNARALNFRAMAAYHLGRHGDAVADATSSLLLASGPGGSATGRLAPLETRAWALARQGRYGEALVDADAAAALAPQRAETHETRALALAGLGRRAEAVEALRRAAELQERYRPTLEAALRLPEDEDMTLLFRDRSLGPEPPSPSQARRRFLRLALFSVSGGLLVALGTLHVASARWRETVHATVRRALRPGAAAATAPALAPEDQRPQGAFWTQYELARVVGVGGMGVVYEAKDRSLERRVAVKKLRGELRLDPEERRRFIQEARLVAQLRHPNIVDIYAIVEEGDELYIVFEFVEGRTLAQVLKQEGSLAPAKALAVLRAVAEAVGHSHDRQIVHRDLKPSNVMLTGDGQVKVMDFGVARQAKDALTRLTATGSLVGTPAYMAPEQEQGSVRRESDVFSLGVCLYEMLTGRLPFPAGAGAAMLAKLGGVHAPPSSLVPALPKAVDAVLARALAPDPERRYRAPGELADALDAALRGASIKAG